MVVGDYVITDSIFKTLRNSTIYMAASLTRPGKFVFKYIHPSVWPLRRERELAILSELSGVLSVARGFDPVPFPASRTSGYFMEYFDGGDLLDYV
jgi:hypothetical protein